MATEEKPKGGELFIVDNSDKNWKVSRYLKDWSDLAHTLDIASGYFEIGALLDLDGQWQKLEKIRILMGDEVSKRTKKALILGYIREKLDSSIETEKETNDFLTGVPAIVDALRRKQIECRVYNKEKFHAKAFITHAKQEVVGASALVGSSNFTYPGLNQNVELNIQLRREVDTLQKWFEQYWAEAEDATEEILKVVERHTKEYSPFEVYAKSLQEFFRSHEMTEEEWEKNHSRIYPILDRYQREGYHRLMDIANKHTGAFLCDGVGLGKTFIGLMLIERFVERERKRVVLFVPKTAREPVWEQELRKYLPHLYGKDFTNLVIFNHTDLSRGKDFPERFERIAQMADVILIDEAHHFRNLGIRGLGERKPSRYWKLFEIVEGKTMFLLTATPVNNRIIDLQHMIELFSRRDDSYFKDAPLGIYSLRGHFIKMEKALDKLVGDSKGDMSKQKVLDFATNQMEAGQILLDDRLFKALVVQRSRAYVRKSQEQHGGRKTIFPERKDPQVVKYSLKKTYGELLGQVEEAFKKQNPLFSLAIYYPLAYYKGPDTSIRPMEEGRQKQVVGLIRTLFLKRFESSAHAFEMSCTNLLLKLRAWCRKHSVTEAEKKRLERWEAQHDDLLRYVHSRWNELAGEGAEEIEDEERYDEDIVEPEEVLEAVEELSRDEYKVEEILAETFLDMGQILEFIEELKKFEPSHDDKLRAIIELLKSDSLLKKHKILIFTEYMATARYLKKELEKAGIDGLDEVDSWDKRSRGDVIKKFAPYYNGSSKVELEEKGLKETRVLISTDVLSEGLNLQDATLLINYDIHWNPVRLMQRIGRLDRRKDSEIEKRIRVEDPKQKEVRDTVHYWNFLPPRELDTLLHLYETVSHKTLRISKTFGVQGKKLLTPEDDYEALKNFNHILDEDTTPEEDMNLEYQKLLQDNPGLEERLNELPRRVFSGKEHPRPGTKAVFFCYALPAIVKSEKPEEHEEPRWSEEAGYTRWYLYDLKNEKILSEPTKIFNFIKCTPDTPRHRSMSNKTLSEIRAEVDKHVKNTYLKKVQAPVGVEAKIKAWMELS